MNLDLLRDRVADEFTLGLFSVDGEAWGFTCEDTDRQLEKDLDHVSEHKIYGKTAIPRGRYRVTVSFSPHFGRILPEVHDVPGFSGVRIHGGNTAADSLGCVLLGRRRTSNGCMDCQPVVDRLIAAIRDTTEDVYLEIR